MRIAFHVPRATFLEPGFSGDHTLVASLLGGLRGHGHEVEIVSRLDARDCWRRGLPPWRLLREAVAVRSRMRRFDPDAWFVYTPSVTYPDLFGWWQRPKRYVLFAADKGRPERLSRFWRPLFTFAHRRSLARADRVAVFRPRGAARLREIGVAEDRLDVLPPAVQPWGEMPSREAARAELGLSPDAPVILCVSRLTFERKDGRPGKTEMVLDLLTALATLPQEVVLLVVGDGEGRARVTEEVARLGLEGRARVMGRVEDVKPCFAACDLFAYPYGLDRPWVAVLEAQASGRPVVTMETDSARLIVDSGRTGLLAKDLDEFRTHLAALAADRARCDAMGNAAREYIAAHHSIETRVRQINELLAGAQASDGRMHQQPSSLAGDVRS